VSVSVKVRLTLIYLNLDRGLAYTFIVTRVDIIAAKRMLVDVLIEQINDWMIDWLIASAGSERSCDGADKLA